MTLRTFFFAIICHGTFAQSQSIKASVVTREGQTLDGTIKRSDWKINPTYVEFTQDNSTKRYSPEDIESLRTSNGQYFVSATVEMDQTEYRTTSVARAAITSVDIRRVRVFLEVLVEGHYGLLYFREKTGKNHYFLKKEDGSFVELILRKLWSRELNQVVILSLYRETLANEAAACPELNERVKKLSFTRNSFIKFVSDVNKCQGHENTFEVPTEKIETEFSTSLGASFSKIRFVKGSATNANLIGATEGSYPISADPFISAKLSIIVPKSKKTWAGFIEAAYKAINTTSTVGNKLKVNYVRLSIGPQYTFQEILLKPSIAFGAFQGFPLSHEIDKLDEPSFNRSLSGFRKQEQGVYVAVGCRIKKNFGTELRIEKSNGVSVWPGLTSPVTSGYLLLSYTFKR